ncbi:ferredoxin III, nif-specific [Vibrio cincinnatiensis]|uniref:ferredoxin III, nif-specific n=1 Tax=Vibrio cincinnatiensis TaxID=675 RepID=UPI001EE0184D|nr:ferredoxin III, nif-specific [Vibrio cincinnatiensis]
MMTTKFSYTRGGEPWAPQFIEAIDEQKCIGCGRCFKVCSRNVFDLIEKEEIGEEDDEMMMVMTLKDQMDCIGCMSCAKVCPKNCQTFTAPAA